MRDYEDFIAGKRPRAIACGHEPGDLPAALFPFQRRIVEWALRLGRAAIFADCGLGKTPMQLAWAADVARHTGRRVLILAPLAVAGQTVREGAKFGLPVVYARTPDEAGAARVVVTNYERLKAWLDECPKLGGVVLDESSILKAFMGSVKRSIVEAFSSTPYRLACTATPAPNDHEELCNHAEFLGVASRVEVLSRFFVNDLGDTGTWRLKGHAEELFWEWVCTWAVMCGLPSDIGYSDDGYNLPPLTVERHIVDVDERGYEDGMLFRVPDMSATSVHREKRRTAADRAARIAELVTTKPGEPWVVWTETDYEADELTAIMPDAVEVRGNDKMELKEARLLGFTDGTERVLITKPSIAGFGLNWQHCARVAFVGATFSFEKFYQAVRRCWRFGQERPVRAHVFVASTETHIWDVLQRKRLDHELMQRAMFEAARRVQLAARAKDHYRPGAPMRLPGWLQTMATTAEEVA